MASTIHSACFDKTTLGVMDIVNVINVMNMNIVDIMDIINIKAPFIL